MGGEEKGRGNIDVLVPVVRFDVGRVKQSPNDCKIPSGEEQGKRNNTSERVSSSVVVAEENAGSTRMRGK